MKFCDGWQVDVLRPNDAGPYADISHGSEKYVVGIPDQPFEVRVTVPQAVFRSSPLLRVNLTVEGQSCGVSKTLNSFSPSSSFKGFVSTVKGKHVTSQFLFGAAQTDFQAPTTAPGVSQTGGLSISIEHIEQMPGQRQPPAQVSSFAAAAPKAIEGKKWFLQPSLAAKAGDVMAGPPVTFSTHVYRSLRVLTKLELRMETAAILVLRKVLDPENPAHQRIIDASQPPDEQEEGEGESANDTSAAASTSSPTGNALSPRGTKRRVKAERTQSNKAVKPEPNQTPRNQNSGGQADVIDLTGF